MNFVVLVRWFWLITAFNGDWLCCAAKKVIIPEEMHRHPNRAAPHVTQALLVADDPSKNKNGTAFEIEFQSTPTRLQLSSDVGSYYRRSMRRSGESLFKFSTSDLFDYSFKAREVVVFVVLLSAVFGFAQRGMLFVNGKGRVVVNELEAANLDLRFHALIIAANLVIGGTHIAFLFSLPEVMSVPWVYIGRTIAMCLVLVALALAGRYGATQTSLMTAASIIAWSGLWQAGKTPVGDRRWMLLAIGIIAGLLSAYIAYDSLNRCSASVKRILLTPCDLLQFTAWCYAAVWIVTFGFEGATPVSADPFAGICIDVLVTAGFGHLLLKREELLAAAIIRSSSSSAGEDALANP